MSSEETVRGTVSSDFVPIFLISSHFFYIFQDVFSKLHRLNYNTVTVLDKHGHRPYTELYYEHSYSCSEQKTN